MKRFFYLVMLLTLQSSLVNGQSFGIGTDIPNPNSILDIVSINRGLLIPRVTLAQRDANMTPGLGLVDEGLLIYNTSALVFNYWDGTQWVPFPGNAIVTADNGLHVNVDEVRMGGTLIQGTTIAQANFPMTFDLTGTGNFHVADAGATKFIVRNTGQVGIGSGTTEASAALSVTGGSYFSDDLTLRDGSVIAGDILGRWFDDNDDGVFELNRNNNVSIRLHANDESVFNERGASLDFRVETDLKSFALFVDGTNNLVRIGNTDTGPITDNGNNINGTVLDYVADFQAGTGISGTAVGLGSEEYIYDAGDKTLATNSHIHPILNVTQDLGTINFRWDDIYCDVVLEVSDERLKENMRKLEYGLDEIMQLKTISYSQIDDPFKERKLGVIAQQVLPLMDEIVKTHEYRLVDEKSQAYEKYEMPFMGVAYSQFIPVLIHAMQEQQAIIESQNEKIESLTTQYNQLLERIEKLEIRN